MYVSDHGRRMRGEMHETMKADMSKFTGTLIREGVMAGEFVSVNARHIQSWNLSSRSILALFLAFMSPRSGM